MGRVGRVGQVGWVLVGLAALFCLILRPLDARDLPGPPDLIGPPDLPGSPDLHGLSASVQNDRAVFAGGCFWSMQHVFDGLPGVVSATAGYAGGSTKNPTYEQVEAGVTGHAESVEVVFDPAVLPYDKLLDIYWHNTDPTSGAGQFCDYGTQYRPIIFYTTDAQRLAADQSKRTIEESKRFKRVLTHIEPLTRFWPAESLHQRFYTTHAAAYDRYAAGCGREARLRKLWR